MLPSHSPVCRGGVVVGFVGLVHIKLHHAESAL